MAREWREKHNGGIYHVIARVNNKEYIFKESIDKGYYIKLLKNHSKTMDYTIYGYVLMDNHYHLAIQVFDKKLQEIKAISVQNEILIEGPELYTKEIGENVGTTAVSVKELNDKCAVHLAHINLFT